MSNPYWSFRPEHERREVLALVAVAANLEEVAVLAGGEGFNLRPCDHVMGRLTPSKWCGWHETAYGSPLHRMMEARLWEAAVAVKAWNPRSPAKKAARAAILEDIANAAVTKVSHKESRVEILAVLA